jgi:cell fate (sporulation/competence/biofilm development) regulator YmcA (YheA/YmcA/DUF963 family)
VVNDAQFKKLVEVVTDMRRAQKRYFTYKRIADLNASRKYEKLVDNLLDEIANPSMEMNQED